MGVVLGYVLPPVSCTQRVESPGRDDHLGRCCRIIRHCACADGQRLALADPHREWTARSVDALSESRIASSASRQNHVYSVGRRSVWLCRVYRPGAPGPCALPDVRVFDSVGGGPLCGLQRRLRKPGLFCRQRCSSLGTVALRGYHVCHVSTVAVQRSCKVGVVHDCTGSFRKLHTG